jgi:molybdopterin converting factor subunit 1
MKILAFGIVKDIFNNSAVEMDGNNELTVGTLKAGLEEKYPRLSHLGSYMIAVNNEYAPDDANIAEGDEVAVIPPVSGG